VEPFSVGPNVGVFVEVVGDVDGENVDFEGDLVGLVDGLSVVGALVGLAVESVGDVVGEVVSPPLVGASDGA
jgi:hypothetical protein